MAGERQHARTHWITLGPDERQHRRTHRRPISPLIRVQHLQANETTEKSASTSISTRTAPRRRRARVARIRPEAVGWAITGASTAYTSRVHTASAIVIRGPAAGADQRRPDVGLKGDRVGFHRLYI